MFETLLKWAKLRMNPWVVQEVTKMLATYQGQFRFFELKRKQIDLPRICLTDEEGESSGGPD